MTKTKIITFRVNEKEYKLINQRANESNLSVSKYVLNSALADNGITLRQKQEIFKSLCIINDAVQNQNNIYKIPEECEKVWQLLNS